MHPIRVQRAGVLFHLPKPSAILGLVNALSADTIPLTETYFPGAPRAIFTTSQFPLALKVSIM